MPISLLAALTSRDAKSMRVNIYVSLCGNSSIKFQIGFLLLAYSEIYNPSTDKNALSLLKLKKSKGNLCDSAASIPNNGGWLVLILAERSARCAFCDSKILFSSNQALFIDHDCATQRVKISLPLASFRPARSCAAREISAKSFRTSKCPVRASLLTFGRWLRL